jgi:hypothetical protein
MIFIFFNEITVVHVHQIFTRSDGTCSSCCYQVGLPYLPNISEGMGIAYA